MKAQLASILEPFMAAVRHAETFLGPEDDWVEDDRRILFEAAQRRLGHLYTFTREKGRADYVCTVQANADVVEEALASTYQRNLLSTRKYRKTEGGKQSDEPSASSNTTPDDESSNRQWAVGSWVYDPTDTATQHHVYLFETENGYTDVYAHREPSTRNPVEHLNLSTGTHGDPDSHLRPLFTEHKLTYTQ